MWKRYLAFVVAMVLVLNTAPTAVYAEERVESAQGSTEVLESEGKPESGEITDDLSEKEEEEHTEEEKESEPARPGQEQPEENNEEDLVPPGENTGQEKPEEDTKEEDSEGNVGQENPEEDAEPANSDQEEKDEETEEIRGSEENVDEVDSEESLEEELQKDTEEAGLSSVYAAGSTGEYQPEGASYQLTYTEVTDGVKITGIRGTKEGELKIPAQIDGKDVVEIGDSAFYYCDKLTGDLMIPNRVTVIGSSAFSQCRGLTGNLRIPQGVTEIGEEAFSYCRGLTGCLVLPNCMTKIKEKTFYECSGLTGCLVLPDSVTEIGDSAFAGCSGLTGKLIIPDGVNTIQDYTFDGCIGITEVRIHKNVERLGMSAFRHGYTRRKTYIFNSNLGIDSNGLGDYNVIYGYPESTAENYVKNNSAHNTFISLEDSAEIKEYRVKNTEELLAAIGSYRRIILADGLYDLGWEYFGIRDKIDLSIEAEHPGKVEMLSHEKTSPVIEIDSSMGINISGCILGHESAEKGDYCGDHGYVIEVWNSTDIEIKNCDLYGCGIWGVSTVRSTVTVEGSVIRDCMEGIVKDSINDNVSVINCILSGNAYDDKWEEYPAFSCQCNLSVKDCFFLNNHNRTLICDTNNAVIDNCTFYNNAWDGGTPQPSGICLNGITWQVDGTVLKLGYPLELDNGIIQSKMGKVLNYSDSSAPWKNCKFSKVQYAEGIEKSDKDIGGSGSGYEPDPAEPVQLKVPTTSIPSGSEVEPGRKLRLTTDITGAQIYYTMDEQEPTRESILYSVPIVITADVTVKAIVVKEGYLDSAVVTLTYRLLDDTVKGEIEEEDWTQIGGSDSDGVPKGLWISTVPTQNFTGKALKPAVRVYNRNILLVEKRDYTLSYKNNTKAGDKSAGTKAPTITVTGKGNYKDKAIQTFDIRQKNLTDEDVTADPIALKAVTKKDGSFKEQKPVPVVTWNGKKLAKGKDFNVAYPDTVGTPYQSPGTYKIVLTGKGNYTGTREVELKIVDSKPVSKLSVAKIKDQIYTGSEIKPLLVVKDGKTILVEDVDYRVSYENNVDVGTASAVIEGLGDTYVGRKRVVFKIKAMASLKNAKAEISSEEKVYSGIEVRPKNHKLTITVNGNERMLAEGIDYEVSYLNDVKKGTATVVFTGIGGYRGIKKKTYKIAPYSINKKNTADVSEKITVEMDTSYAYTKGGSMPKPVVRFDGSILEEKVDYTLGYKYHAALNNGSNAAKLPTVIINGKGNFTGKLTKTFQIGKRNIGELTLTAADKVYKNKNNIYKTNIAIKDVNGKNLTAGRDYDKNRAVYVYDTKTTLDNGAVKEAGTKVGNKDIIPAGTVIRVLVPAKGKYYTGTVSGTYRITAKSIAGLSVEVPSQTYTGRPIEPDEDVKVWVNKRNKEKLTEEDYEIVSYSNNINKGTATLKIRGKNNYGGVKTVKFKIVGKKMSWWKKSTAPSS